MKKSLVAAMIISTLCSFALGFLASSLAETRPEAYEMGAFEHFRDQLNQKTVLEGYKQILKDSDSVIAVPDLLYGRQDLMNGLYTRQKTYLYKNKRSGGVILLSVSASQKTQGPDWSHSIGYTPSEYNQPDNPFKDTYSPNSPDAEVYAYSYSRNGVNVLLIAFAKDSGDQIKSLNDMVRFTEALQKMI